MPVADPFFVKLPPGTWITVRGKHATVVYNGLDGYGVVWGHRFVDTGHLPEPDAMLREPYPSASYECVGEDYEVHR